MSELLVDFITSLDGYASGEGGPGVPRLARRAARGHLPDGGEHLPPDVGLRCRRGPGGPRRVQGRRGGVRRRAHASVQGGVLLLARGAMTWANSTLVRGDAVEAVRAMKENGSGLLSTIGSLTLCRSLLRGGLVDRFRVVMFPVITGATGAERIYDGYPDVALEMIDHRTFDGSIQLVEYRPSVLEHPPLDRTE